MNGSTSSSQARNEPGLTPGEQRILALLEGWEPRLERLEQGQQRLEQGQQRLEQRMDHMEQRMERLEQQVQTLEDKVGVLGRDLQMLTLRVESEAAASKQRDRQLSEDLQTLRVEVAERFNQHNTRLEMLEQAVQRLGEQLTAAIQRAWAPLPTA
ncbi:hypothetical protein [Melittangium boletus]|uniref:Uncharacterized protein n=1 Tax=Melittangium boletus DSM 14713 TaxID=1294270 RepID=A0A250IDM2_9BACT|nr:hypothetical protein [Melittangium boletus]ATB29875.1 hypothetical protein MEBOL_003330 [Melittangium boletus DSM 14713]